jgi:hypothetical protein
MLAGQFQSCLAEAHRQQILISLSANFGHVGQRNGVELRARVVTIGFQRCLVGDDGPVGVAHAVVNGGDGVEQVALIGEIIGGAMQFQRLEQILQCLGIVAGLVVNDADKRQRPHLDGHRTAVAGGITGFERETEGFIGMAEPVRHAGQAVQGFSFTCLIARRSGQHAGLLDQ